ncbi:DUF2742 domain-containing protein [Mycolicibacterium baixiangningiae]|uniref:DUF2742 domain-containing protein n=1 Tax=Mycolicibacterium baixiangningiae TaxID=2761578 RepID=UPI0018683E79|nr:DUF2742 domain-containing protein [Mycolicibacterium baixiangningiae]
MTLERRNPGTSARATSTTPIATAEHNANDTVFRLVSQQVCWWVVHEFVAPYLERAGDWPMVGTPSWCQLDDSDPAKWAAVLDAARHWALRVDTCQHALADAGEAISAAEDWTKVARIIKGRSDYHATRPWAKRIGGR